MTMFMVVGEITEKEVTGTATDPLETRTDRIEDDAKFVPETTTVFPPVATPVEGVKEVIVIVVGALTLE